MLEAVRRRPFLHARRDRREGSRGATMTARAGWIAATTCGALLATAAIAQQAAGPGDALPGLTASEFEEFRLGLTDFLEVETAEDGLGPAYNATSCAVCHNVPAVGGAGNVAELRAVRRMPSG